MLNEQRAVSLQYDAEKNESIVGLGASGSITSGPTPANLLLDDKGYMVGLDLDPEGGHRLVVMLGPHEAVRKVVPARVRVDGARIVVGDAKQFRGHDRNPYL
jgi:hypothetical protein